MVLRKIIEIDEEKCDGCGLCAEACHEGAIQIIDGKARLVSDIYCDGLGDCLGECPLDAITIIEREAGDFDEKAVAERMAAQKEAGPEKAGAKQPAADCGCPSSAMRSFAPDAQPAQAGPTAPATKPAHPVGGGCPGSAMKKFQQANATGAPASTGIQQSQLGHWPIQLMLVPPGAPFLQNQDILICADCVPFTVPDFHSKYLQGKALLVGCPKLDDLAFYEEKLGAIFQAASPRSITVLKMEVPCCNGIAQAAMTARNRSASETRLTVHTIGLQGAELQIDEVPSGVSA